MIDCYLYKTLTLERCKSHDRYEIQHNVQSNILFNEKTLQSHAGYENVLCYCTEDANAATCYLVSKFLTAPKALSGLFLMRIPPPAILFVNNKI